MLKPIFVALLLHRGNRMLHLCYSNLAQLLWEVNLLAYN
jgi:hypothetical protein